MKTKNDDDDDDSDDDDDDKRWWLYWGAEFYGKWQHCGSSNSDVSSYSIRSSRIAAVQQENKFWENEEDETKDSNNKNDK